MNQRIFGDVDLTVHVMANPTLPQFDGQGNQTGKYVFEGLVFQVNCQDCETPTQIGLSWREVKLLLDGGAVQGVERVANGWEVSVQCQNREEDCQLVNKFAVTDGELEKHATTEVARRARVMQAQGQRRIR
jgi:hypothetical protein